MTLAGAQGSSYSNNGGGCAYQFNKQIRLQYNDIVKLEISKRPTYTMNAATGVLYVPGGQPSKMWINGTLVWTAAGGAGQIDDEIVPDACTSVVVQNGSGTSTGSNNSACSVHWHTGNGLLGGTHDNQFPTLTQYSDPGGCYRGRHEHNAIDSCPSHEVYTWRDECDDEGNAPRNRPGGFGPDGSTIWECCICGSVSDTHWGAGYGMWCTNKSAHAARVDTVWDCNGTYNTWSVGCGFQQGQVYGYNNELYQPGNCYYNTAFTEPVNVVQQDSSFSGFAYNYVVQNKTFNLTPESSLDHTGDGMFKIRLVEQEKLNYENINVPYTHNQGGRADLIILDNTVSFFKRR